MSAATKVTTLASARYGPGETRTLAIVGFFCACSRSSRTSASTGRLSNSLVSLIFLLIDRALDRHFERKTAARSAGLSVTQVSQLNESSRSATGILELHYGETCEA